MGKKEDVVDVLVIGAGASGGAFTWSLSMAGIKVVCLDQGGWVPLDAYPTNEPDRINHDTHSLFTSEVSIHCRERERSSPGRDG